LNLLLLDHKRKLPCSITSSVIGHLRQQFPLRVRPCRARCRSPQKPDMSALGQKRPPINLPALPERSQNLLALLIAKLCVLARSAIGSLTRLVLTSQAFHFLPKSCPGSHSAAGASAAELGFRHDGSFQRKAAPACADWLAPNLSRVLAAAVVQVA